MLVVAQPVRATVTTANEMSAFFIKIPMLVSAIKLELFILSGTVGTVWGG